jgi:hypothetical protein
MTDILPMINVLPITDPYFIAMIFLAIIAGLQYKIIYLVRNVAKDYSNMIMLRAKINKDNSTISISDLDILPFIQYTFDMMDQLNQILLIVKGSVMNIPGAQFFRSYLPEIQAVCDATVQQLVDKGSSDPLVTPPATV